MAEIQQGAGNIPEMLDHSLQICRLHIHDVNLLGWHPKAALLDWDLVTVEAFEFSELIIMFKKLVW